MVVKKLWLLYRCTVRHLLKCFLGPNPGGNEGECVPHAAHPGAPGIQGSHPPLQDGQVGNSRHSRHWVNRRGKIWPIAGQRDSIAWPELVILDLLFKLFQIQCGYWAKIKMRSVNYTVHDKGAARLVLEFFSAFSRKLGSLKHNVYFSNVVPAFK